MPSTFSWMNGQLVPWGEARVHVESESVMRGATAFEAVRTYLSASGELQLFRVGDHLRRLFDVSMRFLRMSTPYDADDVLHAVFDLLTANEAAGDTHIRIFVYADHVSIAPRVGDSFGTACGLCITAKEGASEPVQPMRMTLSPWRKPSDLAVPARVKIAANNMTGRIAMIDAESKGFDYPILLNDVGAVSGGSAMNLFVVRDGMLSTPRSTDGIIEGITRDTVLTLARDDGIETAERAIAASELYVADELFFCSTGFEIAPIVELDHCRIGTGQPGPLTQELQRKYAATVRGEIAGREGWLTPVPVAGRVETA